MQPRFAERGYESRYNLIRVLDFGKAKYRYCKKRNGNAYFDSVQMAWQNSVRSYGVEAEQRSGLIASNQFRCRAVPFSCNVATTGFASDEVRLRYQTAALDSAARVH